MKQAHKIEKFVINIHGKKGLGKTSFLSRYTKNIFSSCSDYYPISDSLFEQKTISLGDIPVSLVMYHSGNRYKSLYEKADAHLLLVDITDKESLTTIKKDIESIKRHNPTNTPLLHLAVTKNDIGDIHCEDVQRFVKENGLSGYTMTSAKFDEGIIETFNEIAEKIYHQKHPGILIKEKMSKTEVKWRLELISLIEAYDKLRQANSEDYHGFLMFKGYSKQEKNEAVVEFNYMLITNDSSQFDKDKLLPVLRDKTLGTTIRNYLQQNKPNGIETISRLVDYLTTQPSAPVPKIIK